MSSWYSSWLPGFPSLNLALPSSLQGRFLSFILKKSLGHLLKPGQLDIHQIDSQIGSGYVQVNDVELDNEAINDLISGLPIVLHDGFMSSIIARVPWPNPLTSILGFSLNNLRLTFHLLPRSNTPGPNHTDATLAESVMSVAESFVHEELTPQEETKLWESIHPDLATSVHSNDDPNLPGGLDVDPFLSAPEEAFHLDSDPAGVSLFTTLIERLLARFEFDAINTEITLVHPDNMSITLSIPEIRYRTEGRSDITDETRRREIGALDGEARTASISGVRITVQDLRKDTSGPFFPVPTSSGFSSIQIPVPAQHGLHLSRGSPRATSPASSTSSIDEETQFAMSQSLAFLPRPVSPTGSNTSSSLYQSAISTAHTLSDVADHYNSTSNESRTPSPTPVLSGTENPATNHRYEPTERVPTAEEILTFGVPPIVVRLTTNAVDRGEVKDPSSNTTTQTKGKGGLHLSVTSGVIACALRGWHVSGLARLADRWTSRLPHNRATQTSARPLPPTAGFGTTATLNIRGLVFLIVFPSPLVRVTPSSTQSTSFADFFKRPLAPPTLPQGYLRIHLDNVSGSLSVASLPNARNRNVSTNDIPPSTMSALASSLSIYDLSVFSYNIPSSASHHPSPYISPMLITDHGLLSQYPNTHIHPYQTGKSETIVPLPKFDTIDWTDLKYQNAGIKLSSWRTTPSAKSSKAPRPQSETGSPLALPPDVQHFTGLDEHAVSSSVPAVFINMNKQIQLDTHHQKMGPADEVVIKVVPLHTFVDLELFCNCDGVLALLDEILGGIESTDAETEGDINQRGGHGVGDETLPLQTRNNRNVEKRQRLNSLVLEDLDLGYGDTRPSAKIKQSITPIPGPKISLQFDLIRIQIRCPPPPGRSTRSGTFCIDLHGTKLTTGSTPPKLNARFANDSPSQRSRTYGGNILASIEFSRILLACTAVHEHMATSIISLGSLGVPSSGLGMVSPIFLKPRVTVNDLKPSSQGSSSMVFSVDIPSVYIDVSKPVFNAIQYWIDDVTQLVDRTFGGDNDDTSTERATSRDASLIGSRFFAKSRSGSGIGSTLDTNFEHSKNDTSVMILVSEAFVRIMIPGAKPEFSVRPVLVMASDVDILVELKPKGRDETTFTIDVMDISIKGATPPETFLSLTAPRSLSSAPRSMVKLCFTSLIVPETMAKESRIKVTLSGFTLTIIPDLSWVSDLAAFAKSPPGTFESVIPSERTSISMKVVDGSVRTFAPRHPGVLVIHVGDSDFSTDVVGDSPDSSFRLSVSALALLFIDDVSDQEVEGEPRNLGHGVAFWKGGGFALFAEISDLAMNFKHSNATMPSNSQVKVDRVGLRVHLCADSLAVITAFAGDLTTIFKPPGNDLLSRPKRQPTVVSKQSTTSYSIMNSIEDLAFKKMPEVGPAPDMINDDLPTNMDYLDESFGAAAGLRELRDDDLDEFETEDVEDERTSPVATPDGTGIVSRVGGETIKILRPEGIQVAEGYFDNLPPDTDSATINVGEKTLSLRVHHADVTLLLYEGYDWAKTRKAIEEEVKEMRRRLAKIRQLVANGQTQDPSVEDTSALLFNSLYIGLDQDIDGLEPGALIAAIDDELKDDVETASQSSWQSLKPPLSGKPRQRSMRVHGKRLTRSKGPSMEFCLSGLQAEVDQYRPNEPMVSRTFATVNNLEIFDHIKTSTWKKFLTELRSDSHGNIRETDSNMIRVELCTVQPVPGHPSEEARLRAKILPLRLYVDQDAVDFLKKFFSFKDPHAIATSDTQGDNEDIYFQLAEVFPIDLKLDYKPRRVDYRALREGKTIELMNFFHFDGAEMTLRHITLAGITGWPRFFDLLNDLWTPDVKATQLVEVISGVAPIRSVVNVGSGIADLVLLPIAQYKKDGRIVRGVQKGTTAFVKSTAIEAIKLGARLATGTQVILEQAEGALGGKQTITAEAVQSTALGDDLTHHGFNGSDDEELADAISKYAQQPVDIKEGMQSAYKSLQRNFNSAAQTILAVPMEVYERSGNEGPVRSVIRAVPIAVLRPMIGASEAVSQTLLGLHNTLDPNVRHDNEAKYKSH